MTTPMLPSSLPFSPNRPAHEARRAQLAARLGNRPALIAAGLPRPRNYAANLYPYRASSHFLYLFGLPLRGAVTIYDGAAFTLYLPDAAPDQALWEGAPPSPDEISEATGCPVRPLARLPASVRGRAVATLPAPDVETCQEQSRLLGRDIRRGVIDVLDAPLADAIIELRLHHDDAARAELRLAAEATRRRTSPGMRATRPGRSAPTCAPRWRPQLMARGMRLRLPLDRHACTARCCTTSATTRLARRRSAAGRRRRRDAGRLGRRRHAHLAGLRALLGHAARDLRGRARRAASGDRRGGAGRALPRRARARGLALVAGLRRSRHLARRPDRAGAPRRRRAVVPARRRPPARPRRARHGGPRRSRRLRAGRASARQRSGGGYLRLDRDLAPGMAVTIEPGFYHVARDPRATRALTRVAGDRLDRKRLAASPTCAASASKTTCSSPKPAARS